MFSLLLSWQGGQVMGEDICPYVFCPKCKRPDSWVRYKAKDVISQESDEILWRGWRCSCCGEIALEPMEVIKAK